MPEVAEGDAQKLAQACADAMWAGDRCSQALGMRLIQIAPGFAQLAMLVRKDMLNGHQICHGGLMFTLADSAFAFACNTYNNLVVAQHCSVSFLRPVHENDELIATATEKWRRGRSGIYDIVVTRSTGDVVAEFRGHSRAIEGQHVDPISLEPLSGSTR